jgi:hypothetical protein
MNCGSIMHIPRTGFLYATWWNVRLLGVCLGHYALLIMGSPRQAPCVLRRVGLILHLPRSLDGIGRTHIPRKGAIGSAARICSQRGAEARRTFPVVRCNEPSQAH